MALKHIFNIFHKEPHKHNKTDKMIFNVMKGTEIWKSRNEVKENSLEELSELCNTFADFVGKKLMKDLLNDNIDKYIDSQYMEDDGLVTNLHILVSTNKKSLIEILRYMYNHNLSGQLIKRELTKSINNHLVNTLRISMVVPNSSYVEMLYDENIFIEANYSKFSYERTLGIDAKDIDYDYAWGYTDVIVNIKLLLTNETMKKFKDHIDN